MKPRSIGRVFARCSFTSTPKSRRGSGSLRSFTSDSGTRSACALREEATNIRPATSAVKIEVEKRLTMRVRLVAHLFVGPGACAPGVAAVGVGVGTGDGLLALPGAGF